MHPAKFGAWCTLSSKGVILRNYLCVYILVMHFSSRLYLNLKVSLLHLHSFLSSLAASTSPPPTISTSNPTTTRSYCHLSNTTTTSSKLLGLLTGWRMIQVRVCWGWPRVGVGSWQHFHLAPSRTLSLLSGIVVRRP